jgi:hypothetical protein
MLKILFITDSLGLPRLKPELISGEEVWINILQQKINLDHKNNFLFFNYNKGGLNTNMLTSEFKNGPLLAYEADIVVLQVGIVDCYPRSLKKIENAILSRIPVVNIISKKFISYYYKEIVKFRKISYVNKKRFEKNIRHMKDIYSKSKIFIIPIAPANEKYKCINPLIEENIFDYNLIFKKIFKNDFLDKAYSEADIEQLFLSDNHHLSLYGNKHLANFFLKELTSYKK